MHIHYILASYVILRFTVNRLRKFCHTVKGRRYCFATKVSDDGREDTLPGCIKMTAPIKLNLGCFVLPL